MAHSRDSELILSDLLPIVDIVAEKLKRREEVDSIVELTKLSNVRFPTSRAGEIELWMAVFEAAIDEPPEKFGSLLRNIMNAPSGILKEDMNKALAKVGNACVSRITRAGHPDLGDQGEALLEATATDEMQVAAQTLRETALSIRRLLMRPVLADAYIKLAPTVLDPERRRMELADLAVDVVTATDYLLSVLDHPPDPSRHLLLEQELGPNRGQILSEDDAFFRWTQRRFDARSVAVRLGMRLLEGLRSDVADR